MDEATFTNSELLQSLASATPAGTDTPTQRVLNAAAVAPEAAFNGYTDSIQRIQDNERQDEIQERRHAELSIGGFGVPDSDVGKTLGGSLVGGASAAFLEGPGYIQEQFPNIGKLTVPGFNM